MASLLNQGDYVKEIFFIDNASADTSVAFILQHYPSVRVIANTENLGYARAANQGISQSQGEFIMVMNSDIILEPDYLEILMKRLEKDQKIGAIIGKLLHYDFEKNKKTNIIDSTGLLLLRNHRCVDRGQGEEDRGQYDEAGAVFGVTGACPLYRRQALEDCKIFGEYFDEDFFMYKEDVDLSCRLNLFGWKSWYEPTALASHGRGTGVLKRDTFFEIAKNRAVLSKFQKYYSFKNEWLLCVKNEIWRSTRKDFFHFMLRKILMLGWMIFREPYLIKAFLHFLWQMPRALQKRMAIMRKRIKNE